MRSYGDGDGDVPLSHEQKRQIFAARSAQEQFETRLRTRRAPRQSREAGAQSGVGVGKVLRGRRAYLDRCADEFFESVQSRRRRFGPVAAEEEGDDLLEGSRDEEEEADAHVLETYAQRLVELSSSSSSSAETAPSSFETADRASQFLLLALSLRAPLAASVEEPVISPLYSTPLPVLFAHNPLSGIRYLQAMLDKGRLPTPASIREIVRAYYRDPPVVVWAETGAAGVTTLEEEEARRTARPERRQAGGGGDPHAGGERGATNAATGSRQRGGGRRSGICPSASSPRRGVVRRVFVPPRTKRPSPSRPPSRHHRRRQRARSGI